MMPDRHPAGSSAGGKFAPGPHAEADVDLTVTTSAEIDVALATLSVARSSFAGATTWFESAKRALPHSPTEAQVAALETIARTTSQAEDRLHDARATAAKKIGDFHDDRLGGYVEGGEPVNDVQMMGVYARAIVSAPKHADEFRKAIRNIADYGYRDGETMPCTNCGDTMRGYDDDAYYCSFCFPRNRDHGGEDIDLEYD